MSAYVDRSNMSLITRNASSRCSSRKCACSTVVSLLVAALTSAPNPSNTWAICSAFRSGVPLKSMCSRKCEIPACSMLSSREPTRTHMPIAIERTEGTRSVTTRMPASSSVRVCSSGTARAIPEPRLLAATRVAAVAVAPAAAASPASIALASRATPVAGAHRRELLDRLAFDRRIVRQSQADAAARLVELDHSHGQLVALVDDVLDRLRALPGLQVRDVDQPVGALRQLHEGAEGGRLHDLAREDLAELHVLRHPPDRFDRGVTQLSVGRVHEHHAVVVDVDLRFVLVREGADRLAALADHGADLVGIDLDRSDAWRVGAELGPRLRKRTLHL